MRQSFYRTVIATSLMIGLGTVTVIAAPATHDGDAAPVVPAKAVAGVAQNKVSTVDQRITELHTRLQITPAQQAQWDQFSEVMRANAQDMDATFKTRMEAMPTMTATENMQSYAQVAMGHAQDVQKLVPVFQTLYDTMSDDQKRTADQIFRNDTRHPRHS
jgi:periplasmic protein CpxP/Spy